MWHGPCSHSCWGLVQSDRMRSMPAALLLALAIANFADYPRLRSDVQAHYVSSYDRTGGNDDGFDGTYSALYVDESGEHVIFDVKGPGTLYNLWFTSRVNGRSPLGWGRIKFYFDDEASPRIDMDVDDLFSGQNARFVPPFVYHAFQSTGGYVSYLPFPFQKRLKITTEKPRRLLQRLLPHLCARQRCRDVDGAGGHERARSPLDARRRGCRSRRRATCGKAFARPTGHAGRRASTFKKDSVRARGAGGDHVAAFHAPLPAHGLRAQSHSFAYLLGRQPR